MISQPLQTKMPKAPLPKQAKGRISANISSAATKGSVIAFSFAYSPIQFVKMKWLVLLLMSISLLGQAQDKEYFSQKAKKQKKAGVILRSTGGMVVAIGTYIYLSRLGDQFDTFLMENKNDAGFVTGMVLMFTGTAVSLASIPLYIAASRNKKKAEAMVSVDIRRRTLLPAVGSFLPAYPSLSLKLKL